MNNKFKKMEKKKFGDILKVINGYAFKDSDLTKLNSKFPLVRMNNLKSGHLDLTNALCLKTEIVNDLKKFKLQSGDFIFGMSGSLSNYAWVREIDGVCYQNQRVGRLKSTNSDQKFISYLFISDQVQSEILSYAAGAAQLNISSKQIEELVVLIPPIEEQKKIASILTSIDDVIEKNQSQINKLQDLRTSVMNDLLTKGIGHKEFKDSELGRIPKDWEVTKLSKLFEFKNGLNKEKGAFGDGNPIVNYMDVFLNPIIYSDKIYGKVSLSDKEVERFNVIAGDVFFTRTSETVEEIGMSSVILQPENKTTFSGFILRGRPITNSLYQNLSGYIFRSNYIREQIKRTCSYTTRALTNGSLLGEVIIMLPTLNEQKLIFEILDNIDNLILKKNNLVKKYISLKKSLMQDLLTGKVRVSVN